MGWVDLHCHILPGLDDGSPDMETSLDIGAGLWNLGFDTICATPHVRPGMWDGMPEEVEALGRIVEDELLERLRPPGNGDEVELRIVTGGEHFLDAGFYSRLEQDRLLEYPGDRGVLIELSLMPRASHPGLRDIMFRIRVTGRTPILAHPERYDASHKSLDWIEELHDDGVGMLGDLLSLTGRSGRKSRKTLQKMIDRDLVDGLASDVHSPDDVGELEGALGRLDRLVGRHDMERYLTWGRAFTG